MVETEEVITYIFIDKEVSKSARACVDYSREASRDNKGEDSIWIEDSGSASV